MQAIEANNESGMDIIIIKVLRQFPKNIKIIRLVSNAANIPS